MLQENIHNSSRIRMLTQNEALQEENRRLNEQLARLLDTLNNRQPMQVQPILIQAPATSRSHHVSATPALKEEDKYNTPGSNDKKKTPESDLDTIKDQNEKLAELLLMIKLEQQKRDSACC